MPHKDPAVYRAYQREYRHRNAAKRRAARPDQDRARHANQRAARYGVPGIIRTADVRVVLATGHCFYCGGTERLGIGHVIPLHIGGPNSVENLVCCCHFCNASKHRADRPGRWAREVEACFDCGTTESKHSARGLCNRCYKRRYRRNPQPTQGGPVFKTRLALVLLVVALTFALSAAQAMAAASWT